MVLTLLMLLLLWALLSPYVSVVSDPTSASWVLHNFDQFCIARARMRMHAIHTVYHGNTLDNKHTALLRTNFQAQFLADGESADAEGVVHGKVSTTRPIQSHYSRCVGPPCFGKNRPGNSSQGACYLTTLSRNIVIV